MSLTLDFVMSKSAKRLEGLLPVVRTATERLILRSYNAGIPIVIVQGLRTIAEQDTLYAQGRSKPGQIVTNAKGGYSFHNFGVAVDFALLMPDGKSVSWDMSRDGNGDRKADWMQVAQIGKELGFKWGGDWTSFKDYPHFEMTFGLTTAQYRAGKRPTTAQMDAVIKKLGEDDELMTAAEKKEFEALKELVKRQGETIGALSKQLEESKKQGSLKEVPAWAKEAVKAGQAAGLIDTIGGGSYDFYRLITVLHRAGLLITRTEDK